MLVFDAVPIRYDKTILQTRSNAHARGGVDPGIVSAGTTSQVMGSLSLVKMTILGEGPAMVTPMKT